MLVGWSSGRHWAVTPGLPGMGTEERTVALDSVISLAPMFVRS